MHSRESEQRDTTMKVKVKGFYICSKYYSSTQRDLYKELLNYNLEIRHNVLCIIKDTVI